MREKLSWLGGKLPIVGIVAFSGCSVNALANLFLERAKHPVWWLWPASALVELATAWIVYQIVDSAHRVTKSNISKQDRRFYSIILTTFIILALPSLILSVVANSLEFDNVGLGFVFPLLSVACAIGAALPDTVSRFEKKKTEEKADGAKKKQRRGREKQRLTEVQQTLDNLGQTARQILGVVATNSQQSHADIAKEVGIKRQSVSYHLQKMEEMGLIKRNGQGVELLVDFNAN